MAGALDFLQAVYGVFGFSFELKLSTRPEKFLGEIEVRVCVRVCVRLCAFDCVVLWGAGVCWGGVLVWSCVHELCVRDMCVCVCVCVCVCQRCNASLLSCRSGTTQNSVSVSVCVSVLYLCSILGRSGTTRNRP